MFCFLGSIDFDPIKIVKIKSLKKKTNKKTQKKTTYLKSTKTLNQKF